MFPPAGHFKQERISYKITLERQLGTLLQVVCEVDPKPFDEELQKLKQQLSARDWLGGQSLGVFYSSERYCWISMDVWMCTSLSKSQCFLGDLHKFIKTDQIIMFLEQGVARYTSRTVLQKSVTQVSKIGNRL